MKRLFNSNEKANSLGYTYGIGIQEALKPFVDLAVEDNVSLRDLMLVAQEEIYLLITAKRMAEKEEYETA